jgi:two-component sensor histidine kinase
MVAISLILHELVTNAWIYGALSKTDGLVDLSWDVAAEGSKTVLHLTWREQNGPPVSPPTHSGFGSRMIKQSAEQGLGGTVELKYEPSGLRVLVIAPIE